MLRGDNDGIDSDGAALLVILNGDLGLAVGSEIGELAEFPDGGELLCELMGQGDGHRHELRGLVAGVAEHHALVAGTVLELVIFAVLVLKGLVNAHSDIAGLLVNVRDDAAGVAVKAVFCAVVAYLTNDLARDTRNVNIALGAYLAHDMDKAGGDGGLAGDAPLRVLLKDGVEHGVGDLVAYLIGMPLGHGFGCEKVMAHLYFLLCIFTEL